MRAQGGAVADREGERALAVAEAEPGGGLRLGGRGAARGHPVARAPTALGASKRTGWQREAIVGSTWLGRSVSSRRTT